jgi:hypothetical protein
MLFLQFYNCKNLHNFYAPHSTKIKLSDSKLILLDYFILIFSWHETGSSNSNKGHHQRHLPSHQHGGMATTVKENNMPKNKKETQNRGFVEAVLYLCEVMRERGEIWDEDESSPIKINHLRVPLCFDPNSMLLAGMIISAGGKKEVLGYNGEWHEIHADHRGYHDELPVDEWALDNGGWTDDETPSAQDQIQ